MRLFLKFSNDYCYKFNCKEIIKKIGNYDCDVRKYFYNKNKNKNDQKGNDDIEKGFEVVIFDISANEIKDLWIKLKKLLKLQCSYVETDDYKGCILNSPIIRGSLCPHDIEKREEEEKKEIEKVNRELNSPDIVNYSQERYNAGLPKLKSLNLNKR